MRLACALFALVLLPSAIFAHAMKPDERAPAVGVDDDDKGELLYHQDEFSYKR